MPTVPYRFNVNRLFRLVLESFVIIGSWSAIATLDFHSQGLFFLFFSLVPLVLLVLILFVPRKYFFDSVFLAVGMAVMCISFMGDIGKKHMTAALPWFLFSILALLVYPLQGRLCWLFRGKKGDERKKGDAAN